MATKARSGQPKKPPLAAKPKLLQTPTQVVSKGSTSGPTVSKGQDKASVEPGSRARPVKPKTDIINPSSKNHLTAFPKSEDGDESGDYATTRTLPDSEHSDSNVDGRISESLSEETKISDLITTTETTDEPSFAIYLPTDSQQSFPQQTAEKLAEGATSHAEASATSQPSVQSTKKKKSFAKRPVPPVSDLPPECLPFCHSQPLPPEKENSKHNDSISKALPLLPIRTPGADSSEDSCEGESETERSDNEKGAPYRYYRGTANSIYCGSSDTITASGQFYCNVQSWDSTDGLASDVDSPDDNPASGPGKHTNCNIPPKVLVGKNGNNRVPTRDHEYFGYDPLSIDEKQDYIGCDPLSIDDKPAFTGYGPQSIDDEPDDDDNTGYDPLLIDEKQEYIGYDPLSIGFHGSFDIPEESWFFMGMDRKEATRVLLCHGREGSYLARFCKTGDLALSVRITHEVAHFKINKDKNKFFVRRNQQFPSLTELMDFLQRKDSMLQLVYLGEIVSLKCPMNHKQIPEKQQTRLPRIGSDKSVTQTKGAEDKVVSVEKSGNSKAIDLEETPPPPSKRIDLPQLPDFEEVSAELSLKCLEYANVSAQQKIAPYCLRNREGKEDKFANTTEQRSQTSSNMANKSAQGQYTDSPNADNAAQLKSSEAVSDRPTLLRDLQDMETRMVAAFNKTLQTELDSRMKDIQESVKDGDDNDADNEPTSPKSSPGKTSSPPAKQNQQKGLRRTTSVFQNSLKHEEMLARKLSTDQWAKFLKNKNLAATLSKEKQSIQETVFNIIASLMSYCDTLVKCVSHFKENTGLRNVMNVHDYELLFSNLESIGTVEKLLLSSLSNVVSESGIIDIKEVCTKLQSAGSTYNVLYQTYIRKHRQQIEKLSELRNKKAFQKLLTELEQSCEELELESFLVLPVRHVNHLLLLVGSLSRKMEEGDLDVRECWHFLRKVVSSCNEEEGKQISGRRLEEIKRSLPSDIASMLTPCDILCKAGEVILLTDQPSKRNIYQQVNNNHDKGLLIVLQDKILLARKSGSKQTLLHDFKRTELAPVKTSTVQKCFVLELTFTKRGQQNMLTKLGFNSKLERSRWLTVLECVEDKQILTSQSDQMIVQHDYHANEPDELSLMVGDVVIIEDTIEDWRKGVRIRDAEKGWFPLECAMEEVHEKSKKKNWDAYQAFVDSQ